MLPGSPLPFFSLHEQACLIVIHPIPHDIVGRPGELMAYCFDSHHLVRLCTLSFIVPLYPFVMPSGKMGRFQVCPGEIFIAVSAVALAGDFPVRGMEAPDATTVRGIIPHRGEAIDVADFEHDREAEELTDAWHGEKLLKFLFNFELLGNHLFNAIDLFLKMLNEAYTRHHRKAHLRIGKERAYLGRPEFLDVIGLHSDAQIPCENVLDAQYMRCPVPDELQSFPKKIPGGPFLFRIDVASWKDIQS